MKLKQTLLWAALPMAFLSCQNNQGTPKSEESTNKMTLAAKPEKATFKIDGMVCAMGCAKTIEKKLAKMDGVNKVIVDYETKEATVEFDANQLTPETIVEAVESVADGKTYKVHDMKASGDQALLFSHEKEKDKEKKKDKKKNKKNKASESAKEETSDKKEGCENGDAPKPGCCSKKKLSVI